MFLHYLTLKRQSAALNDRLSDLVIADSYTQNKNEWILAVRDDSAAAGGLLLSADARMPCVVYTHKVHRARNSTTVLNALIGRRIASVAILEGERVMEIRFSNDTERLLLKLFTGHANFFRVDSEGIILDSFKAAKRWIGEAFMLPENTRRDPLQIGKASFLEEIGQQHRQTVAGMLNNFLLLTKPVIRELLKRSGTRAEQNYAGIDANELQGLWDHLQDFLSDCTTDTPRIYYRGEMPEHFALTKMHCHDQLVAKTFDDVNEALRYFCVQGRSYRVFFQKQSDLDTAIERRIRSLSHHLAQLEKQPLSDDSRRQIQEIGELLSAQPHLLKSGRDTVQLVNYFDPEMATLTVAVDPQLSARENAERYFQKARQYEVRAKERQERRELLLRQLEELEQLAGRIRQADGYKELLKLEGQLRDLRILQRNPSDAGQFRLPYKTYPFKQWEIRVGKSARDNDLLTFKHAAKNDFWLHVQGYAGSHVVLRNPKRLDHPPADVLTYGARLAVTNSQAKHASYVPVIYTMVKYVRKPRKSPPGTVVPSHVRSLFVDPL